MSILLDFGFLCALCASVVNLSGSFVNAYFRSASIIYLDYLCGFWLK
jgi:hypothetical protein